MAGTCYAASRRATLQTLLPFQGRGRGFHRSWILSGCKRNKIDGQAGRSTTHTIIRRTVVGHKQPPPCATGEFDEIDAFRMVTITFIG